MCPSFLSGNIYEVTPLQPNNWAGEVSSRFQAVLKVFVGHFLTSMSNQDGHEYGTHLKYLLFYFLRIEKYCLYFSAFDQIVKKTKQIQTQREN